MKACKKPCAECPFRRESAPGYLGEASYDPQGFIGPHWYAGVPLPCHMTVDNESRVPVLSQDFKLCAGFLIMAKNSAKIPEHPEVRIARDEMEPDRVAVFWHIGEFIEHHSRKRADA